MKEVRRSPWFNLQGYLACTVSYEDGSKRTVLQHREVLEATLGRQLLRTEVVHHVDGNKRNNTPENLSVMSRSGHATHHAPSAAMRSLVCLRCGTSFERASSKERRNKKQHKGGPFCGKSCAGSHHRAQQIAAGKSNLRSRSPTAEAAGLDPAK